MQDDSIVEAAMKVLMESITALTEGKHEGHLAIKLTAMLSIDIMTRLS